MRRPSYNLQGTCVGQIRKCVRNWPTSFRASHSQCVRSARSACIPLPFVPTRVYLQHTRFNTKITRTTETWLAASFLSKTLRYHLLSERCSYLFGCLKRIKHYAYHYCQKPFDPALLTLYSLNNLILLPHDWVQDICRKNHVLLKCSRSKKPFQSL